MVLLELKSRFRLVSFVCVVYLHTYTYIYVYNNNQKNGYQLESGGKWKELDARKGGFGK